MDAAVRAAENGDAVEEPWELPMGWCWATWRGLADRLWQGIA
jgi:hypothetical protein